ncbi:AAA family ATPase [Roseibium sp. RKSG952]|uniref:AAA family ATPase n=1 Tax=Roseibium sp. RKSG952 TaxID=2529384 RepID=UPI0012BCF55D|nr:AAA family ATPase [Roseibium sp. RKSG952]MTH96238.1 ATP-binding protein [Roseibium sp. RKSG952]
MILTLAVSGYRSLREVVLPLERITVITGANGSGKSSLYRSIRLLAEIAQGRAIASLAREGGLPSTLWAGPEQFSRAMKSEDLPVQGTRRTSVVSLKLGFADEDYGYAIDLGLPVADGTSFFNADPEIKAEALWAGEALSRANEIAGRHGPTVQVLNDRGRRVPVVTDLARFDSMMTHAADPKDGLELLVMRERMRAWRFYDHFRTDADAPARAPKIGTRTPVLASDGTDLAAALRTIMEIGDPGALQDAVDDAFPGSRLEILVNDGYFEVVMHQHGLLRPLRTAELSDGTLRYLLLIAALLSPRPAPLLVLNEPETSLHPALLEPLARLILKAGERAQVIVVSHAAALISALQTDAACARYELRKELGETVVDGAEAPKWTWPKRS